MFQQLSEELKQAREKKQLSQEQIASKLRIDLKFIQNMENGNFVFLPDIYVKAYLKEYAKAIGLDKDLMIKKYELAKQGKTLEQVLEEEEKKKQEELKNQTEQSKKKERILSEEHFEESISANKTNNQNNRRIIVYISIGILFAATVVYFFFIKNSSDEIITEQPIEKIIEENKQRFEEQKDESLTNQSIISDSLYLSFIAIDSVWCKATLDNAQEKEFYLYPNTKYKISATNNINLIIGNSSGLNLFLNEKELVFPKIQGKRIQLSIDHSGYKIINNEITLSDSL
ncbi:MAG: hypothetical protein STSR0008_10160 [Ignavibacterium sp.]